MGYMSFTHVGGYSGNCFMFLDNPKNEKNSSEKIPKPFSDGSDGHYVFVFIDRDGNEKKEIMLDTGERNLMIWPGRFQSFNENEAIGIVQNRNSLRNIYRFLRLTN
ncbi:MAG: hypothetical protein HC906_11245 [Bacteroidales bacterium]|nr:hypothetical protein [Bacteroidales bacterium]